MAGAGEYLLSLLLGGGTGYLQGRTQRKMQEREEQRDEEKREEDRRNALQLLWANLGAGAPQQFRGQSNAVTRRVDENPRTITNQAQVGYQGPPPQMPNTTDALLQQIGVRRQQMAQEEQVDTDLGREYKRAQIGATEALEAQRKRPKPVADKTPFEVTNRQQAYTQARKEYPFIGTLVSESNALTDEGYKRVLALWNAERQREEAERKKGKEKTKPKGAKAPDTSRRMDAITPKFIQELGKEYRDQSGLEDPDSLRRGLQMQDRTTLRIMAQRKAKALGVKLEEPYTDAVVKGVEEYLAGTTGEGPVTLPRPDIIEYLATVAGARLDANPSLTEPQQDELIRQFIGKVYPDMPAANREDIVDMLTDILFEEEQNAQTP